MNSVQYPVAFLSVPHIIFMVVLLPISAVTSVFLAKKYGFTKKILWVYMILGMICEVEKIIFFLEEIPGGGVRLPPDQLPLNPCPFMVVLLFILVFSKNPREKKALISYMYPMMAAGGFIGMIIPSAAVHFHGLLDLATYRYFFFHSMIISCGIYIYRSKPFDYGMKDYAMALFLTCSQLLIGVWMNAFFGWDHTVNQQFVVRAPLEGVPLLNMQKGWTVYMLNMMGIGVFLVTSCYVPVIIKNLPAAVHKIKEKLRVS